MAWRQNGNTKEGARRKKGRKCASQKFVVLSCLAPLKISKMRTDDNITKKPAHSFIESSWPKRRIASKAANNGSKQARNDALVAPMNFAPLK